MGKNKQYAGYKSYEYLEEGKDYKSFKLTKEIGRVEPYSFDLSPSEEKRVDEIIANSLIISLHDHTTVAPEDPAEIKEYERQGREVTGYEGLSVSGIDAIFDNLMDGTCTITSKKGWKWTDIIYDLGMRLSDIAHQDFVIKCERVSDIEKAYKRGQIALIPSLESATMIENEVDRVDILYGLGVRMMGIVYSESNSLGSGLKEERDGGLTYFGRRVVERLNKIGMAIDIAHAGDRTSLDVIETSNKPVFISHAGARSLWDSKRMKPDEVIIACAERGGLIGIEAAPHTTITKNHPQHNLDSFMEHFEYCVDLVGIDHVTFGPDTFFGDHVAFHNYFSEHMSIEETSAEETEQIPYVKGVENPSEEFPSIVKWLVKHGYSDAQIKKVVGDNVLRVLKKVWSK